MKGLAGVARFKLEARLFSGLNVSIGSATLGTACQRQRQCGEARERCDFPIAKLSCLKLRNARDERKMVVLAAARVAYRPPLTDIAVLDGLGIGGKLLFRGDNPFKARFHEAVIREEVVQAKGLGLELSSRCDDVHALRQNALYLRQELRIHAQLEDRSAPCLTCELRVDDFVGPVAQITRFVHLEQDVRPAVPAAIFQVGLRDNRGTSPYRIQRPLEPRVVVEAVLVGKKFVALPFQISEICGFMPEPALDENIDGRIVPIGALELTTCGKKIEKRQMPACQVLRQVARRQPDLLVLEFHASG